MKSNGSSAVKIISRRRIQLSNQMLRYTRHLLKKWWGLGRLRYWHDSFTFNNPKAPPTYCVVPSINRMEKGKSCHLETKRKIIIALGLALSESDRIFGDDI